MKILQQLTITAGIALIMGCVLKNNIADDTRVSVSAPSIYKCNNGSTLRVSFIDQEEVQILYNNSNSRLTRARSASGEKYSNEQFTWWSKGDEGSLSTEQEDTLCVLSSSNS